MRHVDASVVPATDVVAAVGASIAIYLGYPMIAVGLILAFAVFSKAMLFASKR